MGWLRNLLSGGTSPAGHSKLLDTFLSYLSPDDQRRCLAHVSRVTGDYEVILDFQPESYEQALAIAEGLPADTTRFWGLRVDDGYLLYGRFKVADYASFKSALASLRRHCGKWTIYPEPQAPL